MSAIVRSFEHSLELPFFGIEVNTDLFQVLEHVRYYFELLSDFEEIILFRKNKVLKQHIQEGKHTEVGCHFLLQGIFPTQE